MYELDGCADGLYAVGIRFVTNGAGGECDHCRAEPLAAGSENVPGKAVYGSDFGDDLRIESVFYGGEVRLDELQECRFRSEGGRAGDVGGSAHALVPRWMQTLPRFRSVTLILVRDVMSIFSNIMFWPMPLINLSHNAFNVWDMLLHVSIVYVLMERF